MFQSPVAPPPLVPGVPPVAAGRQTTETDRLSHLSPVPGVPPVAAGRQTTETDRLSHLSPVPGVPPVAAGTTQSMPPLPPTRLAPSSSEPGEFTRMFQSPVAPPTPVPSVPPVAGGRQTTETDRLSHLSTVPGVPPVAERRQTTETDRLSHLPPVPGVPPVAAGTPPSLPPSRPMTPSSPEAGEYTRMFQSPVAPPMPAPGVPP